MSSDKWLSRYGLLENFNAYMISRRDDILHVSRYDDLISHSNDIITRSNDLISRSNDIISRGNELLNKISMSLPGFRKNLPEFNMRLDDDKWPSGVSNLGDKRCDV